VVEAIYVQFFLQISSGWFTQSVQYSSILANITLENNLVTDRRNRLLALSPGSPQYAASEIAADEIAAKNWPPMQKADILNRRLAFRRHQFTPTHK